MSNIITLELTEFKGFSEVTYGYRMYDNYEKTYCNLMTREQWKTCHDPIELLAYALQTKDEQSTAMIDYCVENEEGMMINGQWFDHEELGDLDGE